MIKYKYMILRLLHLDQFKESDYYTLFSHNFKSKVKKIKKNDNPSLAPFWHFPCCQDYW